MAELRVVVVDTGLDLEDPRFIPYLCPTGHKDFTGEGIKDIEGHGTHVIGTIISNAGDVGYCLVIVKYYTKFNSVTAYLQSLLYLSSVQPHFVNISGGGEDHLEIEDVVIRDSVNTTFVVAAGNTNEDISIVKYYPASYTHKNVITVGNGKNQKEKSETSNYGKLVDVWVPGDAIESTCLNNTRCAMTGTSMSTAIHTGRMIKKYVENH